MACANAKRARKRQQQEEIQFNGLTSLIIIILLRSYRISNYLKESNKNTTSNNIQMADNVILLKLNAYAVIELLNEPQSW